MSKNNDYNFGIIVLCPDLKISNLHKTLTWVKSQVDEDLGNIIAIIPPTKDKKIHDSFSSICKTYRSKTNSILSMVNKGMCYTKADWNFVVKAGVKVKGSSIFKKLPLFGKDEKDILYPVTPDCLSFVEDPKLDWMYLHSQTFKQIGEFADKLPFDLGKILWTAQAIEQECNLKGIVGLRAIDYLKRDRENVHSNKKSSK